MDYFMDPWEVGEGDPAVGDVTKANRVMLLTISQMGDQ